MANEPARTRFEPAWSARALQRLAAARRFVAVALGAVIVLLAAQLISLTGAAILAFVILLGAAVIPIGENSRRQSALPQQSGRPALSPGMRQIAQSLPDPCFILGPDGSVRYANDRAEGLFGISIGERLPIRLRYPEVVAAFRRVTSGAGPQQVQFVERIPTSRTFSAWFAPLDGDPGEEAYLLVLDDLTEALAAERMRVDFVANASHELRTPLAALSGFVETLQGPARDDPAARKKFLAMMHDQAVRMSRLIDDLLSLSRVEMRAHVRPNERVDLVETIRHVIDTMTPLASEMGVEIQAELPDGPVFVRADRDELVQVFNNLIENACKYGQSGKLVTVRIHPAEEGEPASVAVIDRGPGIAPEHLPRLTERFYRVDADESRRHRGTGLGLAIVKHILSRHRARLLIESTPGKGAQFAVHFPGSEAFPPGAAEKDQQNQTLIVS